MIAVRIKWMAIFALMALAINGCSPGGAQPDEDVELNVSLDKASKEAIIHAKELNAQLSDALREYVAASAVDKASRLEVLQASAKARKDYLASAVKRSPAALLAVGLTSDQQRSMPKEVADQNLEAQVGLEGPLKYYHRDHFTPDAKLIPQRMEHLYNLTLQDGQRVPAYFADGGPRKNVAGNFKVEGLLLEGAVVVKSYSSLATGKATYRVMPDLTVHKLVASPPTATPDSGNATRSVEGALTPTTHNIALILYKFHATSTGGRSCRLAPGFDFTSEPITPALARSMLFTGTGNTSLISGSSVNSFFRESTYGNLQFTGDVFGWVTVGDGHGGWFYPCHTDGNVEVYDNELVPLIQASTPGFNINNYDVVIYASNFTDGTGTYETGTKIIWASSDKYERWPVFAHELGHRFGLDHAHSLNCLDSGGLPVPISDNCTAIEYGDFFDVMAANVGFGEHDVYEKLQLGVLDPSNVRNVTSSGTYTLAPIEQAPGTVSGAYTALKIPAFNVHRSYVDQNGGGHLFDREMYYYVEFHGNTGFDSGFSLSDGTPYSYPAPNGGVLVKFAPNPSVHGGSFVVQTQIPHATPVPPDNIVYYPLPASRSFVDVAADIGIETIATTANSATVRVSINGPIGCTYATNPVTYDGGRAIAPNNLTCAVGPVTSCDVSPPLPRGLVLAANCQISGTPLAATPLTRYTVYPSNPGGRGFATIDIMVRAARPSGCSYLASPATLNVGCPVPGLYMNCTDGTDVTGCSISPALPSGLLLDPTNCTIAGTPTAASDSGVYTVAPSNTAGSATTNITLGVQQGAPSCHCPPGMTWEPDQNRCVSDAQACRDAGCSWRMNRCVCQ